MVASPQARKFESVPPGITWMARRHVASCTSRFRAKPMGAADSALMHPPMAVAGHVREVGTRRVGGRGGRTGTRCSPLRGTEQRQVSYTHLRAHETRHDLVCRLLLEKKK